MTAPSRTERYIARVEAHLPTLPDDAARRRFLAAEFRKWDERYDRFIAAVDADRIELTGDHPTAWDFTDTISAIAALQGRYERKAA